VSVLLPARFLLLFGWFIFNPEDGGSIFFRNVDKILQYDGVASKKKIS
jgi:hypothetical protein